MKKILLLLFVAVLCLPLVEAHGQLIQSSSLITTVDKLKPFERGFQSHIQFSYAALNPINTTLDVSISYIGGLRFNNLLYLGAGAEFQYANNVGNSSFLPRSEIFLPLFAHFRAYFLKKRVSPFAAFSAGYLIATSGKTFEYNDVKSVKYGSGSLFCEPTLGVSGRVSHKSSLYLSLSYRIFGMARLMNKEIEPGSYYKSFDIKRKTVGSLRINLGVTF